ncbi:endonuclease/exonuclease/phosphatase family protein [Pseudonocardia sp. CA-107938]|uniref:endonuclease/exonuclease/phosphatase family protein n=1 Tax=Pseudonocardia sp. CA-107938 TaxID=3240021 RepID=UPI003D931975
MRTGLLSAATVAAAVALHGDRLGLDGRHPLVGVAALRPYVTAATAGAAAVLASRRPVAATVLAGLAAAAAPSLVQRLGTRPAVAEHPDDLVVLAANVWHGRALPVAFAALLERERPDLVAVSEAGHPFLHALRPHLAPLGYRTWTSAAADAPDGDGVALLAGPRAGELTVSGGPEVRTQYLRATGGILGERALIAVHTAAPTTVAGTREWRRDLADLARWSHEPVAPIIAGDLNATLDHALLRAVLGPVASASIGSGRGLVGTFPTALRPNWPALIGIHIDHVLVPTGSAVPRYAIVDVPGSDHRAVLARVRIPVPIDEAVSR